MARCRSFKIGSLLGFFLLLALLFQITHCAPGKSKGGASKGSSSKPKKSSKSDKYELTEWTEGSKVYYTYHEFTAMDAFAASSSTVSYAELQKNALRLANGHYKWYAKSSRSKPGETYTFTADDGREITKPRGHLVVVIVFPNKGIVVATVPRKAVSQTIKSFLRSDHVLKTFFDHKFPYPHAEHAAMMVARQFLGVSARDFQSAYAVVWGLQTSDFNEPHDGAKTTTVKNGRVARRQMPCGATGSDWAQDPSCSTTFTVAGVRFDIVSGSGGGAAAEEEEDEYEGLDDDEMNQAFDEYDEYDDPEAEAEMMEMDLDDQ